MGFKRRDDREPFNEIDVRNELRKLGYRTGSCTGKAFILTKAGGKPRKYDGLLRQQRVGDGIDVPTFVRIMQDADDATEAAARCEAVCLGRPDPYSMAPSAEDIEKRVQDGIKSALAQLGLTAEVVAQLKKEPEPRPPMEAITSMDGVAPSSRPPPPPMHVRRKGGRPKGSKNKPKAEAPTA
jgi:hypothetical protein